jgi:hypothetical protein
LHLPRASWVSVCLAQCRLSDLFTVLTSDFSQLPIYLTITKMCFGNDDYRDSYETRVEIRNGRQYYTQEYHPGYGMSRRRKYGFGGSYYPSRYYARPPTGRYTSSAYTHPSQYIHSGRYPRGVVPGGYSRGAVSSGYSQAMVPRNYVGGGYPGYSSGHAYGTGQHVVPVNSAMVSFRSFLFSDRAASCLPSTTPPPYPAIIGSHMILNIACTSVSIAATTFSFCLVVSHIDLHLGPLLA